MSNQTLAEKIDLLYEARLRNPEHPEDEFEVYSDFAETWVKLSILPDVLRNASDIRLKPKAVTREITYPEPLRDAPEHGAELYRAAPEISERYDFILWHRLDYQAQWLRDGLLHSTKEAAIAHGKTLPVVSDATNA